VGISYSDDSAKAVATINEVLRNTTEVCQDPVPLVGIKDFADSSIK